MNSAARVFPAAVLKSINHVLQVLVYGERSYEQSKLQLGAYRQAAKCINKPRHATCACQQHTKHYIIFVQISTNKTGISILGRCLTKCPTGERLQRYSTVVCLQVPCTVYDSIEHSFYLHLKR